MNKVILILGLLICSLSSFSQQLEVSIIQEGKKAPGKFDKYKLKKSPFTFQLKSHEIGGGSNRSNNRL